MSAENHLLKLEFVGGDRTFAPCWRLVTWDGPRIHEVEECAEYATLRARALNRGVVFPTKLQITRALAGFNPTATEVWEMLNFTGENSNASLRVRATDQQIATGVRVPCDGGGIFASRHDGKEFKYDYKAGWLPL